MLPFSALDVFLRQTSRTCSVLNRPCMCCTAQDIEHPILSHGKESSHCCHILTPRYTRVPRSRTSTVTSLIAESVKKSQKKDKVTLHSPAEDWALPAASTKEPEEREFAVDSGASMHMVCKRDLNSAELVTMRTSRRPTTVMTANGEVRTTEEATENVKQLDLFVTVMLLEETTAVFSLGKLCEDHGYTDHCTSGQKPHLTKNGNRINCNRSNNFTIRSPWFIDQFLYNAHTYFIIFITGFRI